MNTQKGSTATGTPIIIAISMFLIALLTVVVINMIMPYLWYEKLSLETLKYIFVMEEYGYLTDEEKTNLKKELVAQNFDGAKLDIAGTDAPVDYGEPIYLNVIYNYTYKLPMLSTSTLSTTTNNNNIQMIVRRQSVSKR